MIYRFTEYEIDTERYELRCGGVAKPIEPQVFDLLRYLVENSNRTVTKDELHKAIWPGRLVSESALSSRIKVARQAIGDNGRDQLVIRTVHGRGFHFLPRVAIWSDHQDQQDKPSALISSIDYPVDEKPSIAVLPFENLAGSKDDEYFTDGITDEITILLAKHRWLRVVSRNSSFAFKGRHVDIREIGQALGARYLLEGSVRRAGSFVRIAVQLVNGSDGKHLWADRCDRELKDIFQVQEDISQCIAGTLAPELAYAEEALTRNKRPENLTAWDYYQRGRWRLFTYTDSGFAEAERLFARAISVDPDLAQAHSGLAYAYIQQAFYAESRDRSATIEAAMAAARHAVAADERDAEGHFVLGRALSLQRKHDEAIDELKTALELNPSFAQAYYAIGLSLTCSRRPSEAIAFSERFEALSPRDPGLWANYFMRSLSHFWLGELEVAERCAQRSVRHPNATFWSFATLASVLGAAGKKKEAEEAAETLLERKPGLTLETARDSFFFMDDRDHLQTFLDGLSKAGIR